MAETSPKTAVNIGEHTRTSALGDVRIGEQVPSEFMPKAKSQFIATGQDTGEAPGETSDTDVAEHPGTEFGEHPGTESGPPADKPSPA